jgi:hypothetical protein
MAAGEGLEAVMARLVRSAARAAGEALRLVLAAAASQVRETQAATPAEGLTLAAAAEVQAAPAATGARLAATEARHQLTLSRAAASRIRAAAAVPELLGDLAAQQERTQVTEEPQHQAVRQYRTVAAAVVVAESQAAAAAAAAQVKSSSAT